MNPDANERNGMYLKQVPWLCWGINRHHPEEYQNPSSKSIKCCATSQSKDTGGKQGKTFEHNKVLTRELMSCLSNPRFNKPKRTLLLVCGEPWSHTYFSHSVKAYTWFTFWNVTVGLFSLRYKMQMFYMKSNEACDILQNMVWHFGDRAWGTKHNK